VEVGIGGCSNGGGIATARYSAAPRRGTGVLPRTVDTTRRRVCPAAAAPRRSGAASEARLEPSPLALQ